MGYIYIVKNNVNSKVYIGQTKKSIEERWKEHIYSSTYRNQILYIAMRKYGVENFFIEEIEHVDVNTSLDEREIFWINHYDSVAPNGYNATNGGSRFTDDNPMYHEEIRQKVSERFKGDKNPSKRPGVREKIRSAQTGKKASEETKAKMSKNNGRYWKGKHLPEETKRKISENHAHMFGGDNPNSKRVARIDKNTDETIEIYESISCAIKWVKENVRENALASNISQAVHGRQKTAFGYKWKLV